MSLTLALVTCGPEHEVALQGRGLRGVSAIRLAGVAPRSTLVLAAVDLLAEDAGAQPGELEQVLVSCGPGSFTGIRSGLATAAGLAAALGISVAAHDSLTVQAARCSEAGTVWAAQPGRRGELYVRPYRVGPDLAPQALEEISVLPVAEAVGRGPWFAAGSLDLGEGRRGVAARSAAEALLVLAELGAPPRPPEPLYVEGPPINQGRR